MGQYNGPPIDGDYHPFLGRTPKERSESYAESFARGWREWVDLGTERGCRGPFALAGYRAAAFYNDHGGGPRPTLVMGEEFAIDWLDAGMPVTEREIAKWLKGGA